MSGGDEASEPRHEPVRVDPKLLEILVCPVTKTRLDYDAAAQELISRAAGLAFPIQDGVPMMIVSAARTLDAPPSRSKA